MKPSSSALLKVVSTERGVFATVTAGDGIEPDRAVAGPVMDGFLWAIIEELSHGQRAPGGDVDEQLVV